MTTLTNGASSRNHSTYITLFNSRTNPQGTRQPINWNHWFQSLSQPPATYKQKTDIPGWSAATFADDHRNNTNVELISALVLDVDDGGSIEDAHYAFRDYFGFIHTSYSHGSTEKEGKPCSPRRCFRIILPLARPATPDEYQQLWLWAQHHTKQHHIELDSAPKAPGQFWYLPALRPGAEHLHHTLMLSGTQPINLDLLLSQAPQTQLLPPNPTTPSLEYQLERGRKLLAESKPSIQGQHGSKALLNVAIGLRRGLELLPKHCIQLIEQHFNPRCDPPWERKDIEKKVADADTKSSKPWGYLLREKTANGGAFQASPSETHERRTTQRRQHIERRTLDPWTFHTTDTGNAERLVAQHGQNLRYCHPWQKWLVWDEQRWKVDDRGTVRQYAKETAHSIYAEAVTIGSSPLCRHKSEEEQQKRRIELAQWARRTEARERREAMTMLAQSEHGVPVVPSEFDEDPWVLNVHNGTLDLRTGILKPHQRNDLITKVADTHYDPNATCPRWVEFVHKILQGNEALTRFVQNFAGYALTGVIREHVLVSFYGRGSNGKSTFLQTLLALMGDYGFQMPQDLILMKNKESHPTDLASLFGIRLAICIETAEGRRMDEVRMKQLTGGDQICARKMREDFWNFKPTHKLILGTNHKPIVTTTDHGTWRRQRPIPFTVQIPEEQQDTAFPETLRKELPGILRWAVEGCLRWQKEGLGHPDEIRKATEIWRGESDALRSFLESCCEINQKKRIKAKELYRAYTLYCEQNGDEPLKQQTFGRKLTEKGFEQSRTEKERFWKGLSLQIENTL